jgi:hypothetical protein
MEILADNNSEIKNMVDGYNYVFEEFYRNQATEDNDHYKQMTPNDKQQKYILDKHLEQLDNDYTAKS